MSALGQDDLSLEAAHLFELVAQENLKDAETAYRLGGGPRIDVANARKEVNRARRATLEVESRRAANLIDLMTATSGRWSPDETGQLSLRVAYLACAEVLPGAVDRRPDAFEHDQEIAAFRPALEARGLN